MPDQLIIFDCDGVLVDSEIIACRIEAEELTNIGFDISLEDNIRLFAGKSQKTIMSEVEKKLGRKLPDNFSSTLEDKILAALDQELRAIKNAKDILKIAPYKCIASSGTPQKIMNSLKTTHLADYFSQEHMFSATQVKQGKPAPDLFLYAAAEMKTTPSQCVVIEDSVYGIKAANAAGMLALGFTDGSHILDQNNETNKLFDAGADEVFSSMIQLKDFLQEKNYI